MASLEITPTISSVTGRVTVGVVCGEMVTVRGWEGGEGDCENK